MAPPKNNQFWKKRTKHGRDKIFADPDVLWDACCEYFDWVEKNPLKEEKVFPYKGKVTRATVSKMRAMTIGGLCLFLDISTQTWYEYKGRDDFSDVITRAEEIIRNQKFTGAAADLLNQNIIARDLGMHDKDYNKTEETEAAPVQIIIKAQDARKKRSHSDNSAS